MNKERAFGAFPVCDFFTPLFCDTEVMFLHKKHYHFVT